MKFYRYLKGNPPEDFRQWVRQEITICEWVKENDAINTLFWVMYFIFAIIGLCNTIWWIIR